MDWTSDQINIDVKDLRIVRRLESLNSELLELKSL